MSVSKAVLVSLSKEVFAYVVCTRCDSSTHITPGETQGQLTPVQREMDGTTMTRHSQPWRMSRSGKYRNA